MSLREVTYYQVACDQEGCTVDTDSLSSDYSAWSDRNGAEEEWQDDDHMIVGDGRHFCVDHRRGHECDHCDWTGDGATPADDCWLCPSCAKEAGP